MDFFRIFLNKANRDLVFEKTPFRFSFFKKRKAQKEKTQGETLAFPSEMQKWFPPCNLPSSLMLNVHQRDGDRKDAVVVARRLTRGTSSCTVCATRSLGSRGNASRVFAKRKPHKRFNPAVFFCYFSFSAERKVESKETSFWDFFCIF